MANGVGSRNLVSKKDLKDRMTSSKLAKYPELPLLSLKFLIIKWIVSHFLKLSKS